MAELTLEQCRDPEFLNPDRWVDFTSKEMVLLDPANGNPYKPGEPPEWIASDPRLVRGYELLGNLGSKHELTIAYGSHQTAKDLNRSIWHPRWYEKQVAKSGAVGFEIVGWSRVDCNGGPLINAADLAKTNSFGKDNSFMRRIGQTALDNQKPLI